MLSFKVVIILSFISVCVSLETNNFLNNNDYTIKIKNVLQNTNISKPCLQQFELLLLGLNKTELWALQMIDAHSKIPSGILAGNFYDLGNYDECLNLQSDEKIYGKYCLGTIPLPNSTNKIGLTKGGQLRMLGNDPKFTGLHYAVCIPHLCNIKDISQIYNLINFDEKYCYSQTTKPEFKSEAIIAITILSFFLLLVILSTGYDLFLYYNNYKPGKDFTIAFSYFFNGKKLISTSKNPEQLLCLNGMKAISMMWIIMGHEYVNGSMGPVANYYKIINFTKSTANMFVIGATVAVDTFFVIGGLVTVYTFLKTTKKGVKFNILLYYLHRYIRLTPALAVVVLIHATLLKHFGDGPLWNSFDDHLVEPCKKHFWAALLYIQNYVHDEQACVPQTWYLSIDMQLFVLSPLVLIPLKWKPKWALIGLSLLTIAGILIPFLTAYFEEINAFLTADKDSVQKYMFSYYEQTYGRFGAYVIGMILGYLLFKIKQGEIKIELKPIMVLFLWLACLVGSIACVYAGHDTMLSDYNKWSHSLYIAFNRPAWSLAISGIIFLCVSGYGGPVNVFLSAPIFQFLSKISYSIYLVHYELILLRACSYKTEIMIEDFYVFFNFWGDFMFSVALAVLLCLTFESPIIIIEKIIFGKETIEIKTRTNFQA